MNKKTYIVWSGIVSNRSKYARIKMLKIISVWIIVSFFFSCEKRMDLETEFPFEKERIFCEVIGLVETGFFGTITQVQPVESIRMEHQPLRTIIREEGRIIFNDMLYSDVFNFVYRIKDSTNYSIEIIYKNQMISSPDENMASPDIFIKNLVVNNEFVDSLGFHVANFNFAIFVPPQAQSYYSYVTEVIPSLLVSINLIGAEPTEKFSDGTTVHITKRIPNIQNYPYSRTTLFSIDKSLYQYLKNIHLLGNIPNDDIEGHQGNLDGGLGYFGIVNYDTAMVKF